MKLLDIQKQPLIIITILTIHGIITSNTLIYINTILNNSSVLPLSIVNTISKEMFCALPLSIANTISKEMFCVIHSVYGSSHETRESRLKIVYKMRNIDYPTQSKYRSVTKYKFSST